MGAFSQLVLRMRGPILLVVAVVTALLAWRLPTLRQDEDVLRFLPEEDPDIIRFREVSAEFGGLDVAIVGVESPRLLTADGMDAVRRMAKAAERVEGVYHVVAFTEMPHLTPTEAEFRIDPLVPQDIPRDPASVQGIRETILGDRLVAGRLVSRDGTAAMVLCFLETSAPQQTAALEIQRVVTAEAGHMRLYFGGLPFVQAYVGGGTRRDIVALTPYVLLLSALATFLFFRRPLGALLVLSAVAIGTVWTIGGMAAAGAPMTVVSTSLPMVLVAIGGAYGAHILAAFYVAPGEGGRERIEHALKEVGPPVIASMLTTIAGFASFLAMDVAPMRAFGFQASVGVFLCGILALVIVPAVLSFARGKAPAKAPAERLAGPVAAMALATRRHKWATVGTTLAVGALAGAMAWRVVPDTSLDSFFRPDSMPARSDAFLREQFGGSVFVQAYVRGDLNHPVVLDELRKIVEEAQTIEGVSDVNSFLETLETLAAGLGGLPRIPQTRERVAGLGPFMAGNPGLRQLVDDAHTRAMVQITVGTQDTRMVGNVVDHLDEFIAHDVPRRVRVVDIHGSGPGVEEARRHRLDMVARRAVRILRGHRIATSAVADERVRQVLVSRFGALSLAPGRDLDREVEASMEEFFDSDDSPFDPIEGAPVGVKLADLARRPVTRAAVAERLPAALPAELAADAEGMALAVPTVTDRIAEARARVIGKRLLPEVLRAAGAEEVDPRTRDLVRGALEELDDALVGLPTDGPEGLSVEAGITGTPVVNRAFGRSTQRNQIRSIVISVVTLMLLGMVMFRSLKIGFVSVLPAGLTLLITFGLMGWLHVPLDPGTCMVAALALGIGIDYALHFLWRRRWRGMALDETARTVGPAVAFNAVQVASGFAVMIVADTVPLSRFGVLVTVAMVVAAIVTFTLLPGIEPRTKREAPEDTEAPTA